MRNQELNRQLQRITSLLARAPAAALDEFLSEAGRKEAIDGIMSQRHQIAHGRDAGITVARVTAYLTKSVEVIEFVEDQCMGS